MFDGHTPSMDRILVALDASPHSRAALNAAVRLAVVLDAKVQGLFVEDETLLRAANLPFAREVRGFTQSPRQLTGRRMQRQMRDRADYAEHLFKRLADEAGLSYAFEVLRGNVVDEVVDAAEEADLLALGKAGERSSRRRLGPKARALLKQAPAPVLVLRERLRYFQPVLTYYDGSDASTAALRLAARLSRRSESSPLKVLVPGGDTDAYDAMRADVHRAFRGQVPGLFVRAVTRPAPQRLAAIAREESSGLVVLPDVLGSGTSGDGTSTADPQSFLYELDSPVLLVR